jgi:hypothetical protein
MSKDGPPEAARSAGPSFDRQVVAEPIQTYTYIFPGLRYTCEVRHATPPWTRAHVRSGIIVHRLSPASCLIEPGSWANVAVCISHLERN